MIVCLHIYVLLFRKGAFALQVTVSFKLLKLIYVVGGFDFQIDENHPSQTIVTYIVHADARGSLPIWLMNSVSLMEAKKLYHLKKLSEHKQKMRS